MTLINSLLKIILSILFLIVLSPRDYSQNFIYAKNEKFYRGDSVFSFLGFSAYYLQWIASDSSKKYLVDKVFRTASENGVKVIRTWGFNSNNDSSTASCIRYSPYGLKENGLRALDYIIYKAKQYDVYLILTIENNFNDFGGIKQYTEWADRYIKPITGITYSHEDFFTDDSMKCWYKYYMRSILDRVNTYTGTVYKDEPDIFSFELVNEAENDGGSTEVIRDWYSEMADYFKLIDHNHLVTTGETGYDNHKEDYSDSELFYNNIRFLFNGYKGSSFAENSSISNIDYSSFHLYPENWGCEPLAGNTWINDHTRLSDSFGKPSLLGEFGVINERMTNYKIYLETIRDTPSRSALIWQYVPEELMNIADSYAFNEVHDPDLLNLFKEYNQLIAEGLEITDSNNFILYQNYPNPFNPSTTIRFTLRDPAKVKIELFNSLGELVRIIYQGNEDAGTHYIFLSFDNSLLSSGVYFYSLMAVPSGRRGRTFLQVRKMVLLK